MLKMVKKQGEAAAVKVTKLKVTKSSSLTRVAKSQPLKSQAKCSSSKRPAKSLPGFSLYSSESEADDREKEKSSPRWKRSGAGRKPSPRQQLTAAGGGDDVVSQVQLVEEAGGFKGLGIYIPTARVESPDPKALSPDLMTVQDDPNMSTPFNKRLVSSTPDPERLLEADVMERLSAFQVSSKTMTDAAPQLIPERDTFDPKVIASMPLELATGLLDKLKQQRQNLIWQQQLHQYKVKGLSQESCGPSTHGVSNIPVQSLSVDTLPSGSSIMKARTDLAKADLAKADLIKTDLDKKESTKVDLIKTESVKADLILDKPVKHKAVPRAEWVQGSKTPPMSQLKETPASPKQTWERIGPDEGNILPAYNGFGVTSSQSKSSVTEVVSLASELHSLDPLSIPGTNVEVPNKMNFHTNNAPVNEHYEKFSSAKQNSSRPKSLSQIEPQSKAKAVGAASKVNLTRKPASSSKVAIKPLAKKNRKEALDPEADERGKERSNSLEDVSAAEDKERKTEHVESSRQDLNSSADTCDEEVNSLIQNLNFPEANKIANTLGDKQKKSTSLDSQDNIRSTHKSLLSVVETGNSNGSAQEKMYKDVLSEKKLPAGKVHNKASEQEESSQAQDCDSGISEQYKLFMGRDELSGKTDNDNKSVLSMDKVSLVGMDTDREISGENNTNQNYNQEDSSEDSTPRRRHKLKYLEKMADPRLRDIACRLALKATAVRDVELRDLIDDMVFHTDATLAHEEARFHASQLFFAEENNKLKKRLHTVNQQMEAKERQEKTRDNGFGMSDNEVHLERKNQYLQEEKERLDNQVTVLLEEKARWLITQQDLVRTISLKDHETLKLEQKHQEEKTALHQAVEHAASKSQGMHYKLSVADREISNLEQRVKVKDREIGDLKDKMQGLEERLRGKESVQLETEREVLYLQDLVSSLKEGVDQVLKAYEFSIQNQGSTSEQQKGMDTLRQIVQSSRDVRPTPPQRFEPARTVQFRTPSSAAPLSISSSSRAPLPQVQRMETSAEPERQRLYSERRRHRSQERERQDQSQREVRDESLRSRHRSDEDTDGGASVLTSEALAAHNLRHSPVDHSLWRSLDDGPTPHPHHEQETYHSDSEILVNTRDPHRSQNRQSQGISRRSDGPLTRSRLSGKEPEIFEENWDSRQKSRTTVRSEELRDIHSGSRRRSAQNFDLRDGSAANGRTLQAGPDHLRQSSQKRDDSYYSTLRSKSITHPSGFTHRSSRPRRDENFDRREYQMRDENFDRREFQMRDENFDRRESQMRDENFDRRESQMRDENFDRRESQMRDEDLHKRASHMRESERRHRSRASSLEEDHPDTWSSQHARNVSTESDRRNRSSELRRRELAEDAQGESFGSERQRQKEYRDGQLQDGVGAVPVDDIPDEDENERSRYTAADYVRQYSGQSHHQERHSISTGDRERLRTSAPRQLSGESDHQERHNVSTGDREPHTKSVHSIREGPNVPRPDPSGRKSHGMHRQFTDPTDESTKYSTLQSRPVSHPSSGTTSYSSLQSKSMSQPSTKSTQISRERDSELEDWDEREHHQQRHFSPDDDSLQLRDSRSKLPLSSSSPGREHRHCSEQPATFTSLEHCRDKAEPLHSTSLPEPRYWSPGLETINFTPVSPRSRSYSSPSKEGSAQPQQEQNDAQASQGQKHLLGSFKRPAPPQEPVSRVPNHREERSVGARTLPRFVERNPRERDTRITPRHFSLVQQEPPARYFDRSSGQSRPASQEWEDSPRRDNELSFSSDFFSGRTTIPTQSSPREISVSRRATRPSDNFTQSEFFQGTDLSTSFSSISEDGQPRNNNQLMDINEDPFSTGIASLDSKIARLQAKINHTKAVFS